ncbi:vomeronasal type-2 receptor 26-like [Engystomops pustulosus]|uniref:vomeronasal type-2 receptor 26-like n=1 Tax=Engystomops pustulosus TaxID=76066 RepID=UPI003AFA3E43
MDGTLTYFGSYIVIIFLPVTFCSHITSRCVLTKLRVEFDYKYHQEGDIIIGGLISAHFDSLNYPTFSKRICLLFYCTDIRIDQYKQFMAFIFAINESNKTPELLPNITLGYHIIDTCGNPRKSIKSAIQIMSGKDKEVPNYSRVDVGEVVAFVGNSGFHSNSALIQFLSLYKFTQINYGPADPLLSDRVSHPTLFQIASDDWVRYEAIIKCLQYFGWNWVGIITPNHGIGEMESAIFNKMMIQSGICIDFIIKLEKHNYIENKIRMAKVRQSRAEVIVICGLYYENYARALYDMHTENITLILHESWIGIIDLGMLFAKLINCSFILMLPRRRIPNFNIFQNLNPITHPDDPLLEDLWYFTFNCLTKNKNKNRFFQLFYEDESAVNCTEIYEFPQARHKDSDLYFVYTSVYILAHGVNQITQRRNSVRNKGLRQEDKLSKYMKKMAYIDHNGEIIVFNKRGEVLSEWNFVNWAIVKDKNNKDFIYSISLATFKDSPQQVKKLHIDLGKIVWKNNRMPQSRCNDPCSPGSRKALNGGYKICCYDCVPCSEGEVSNITDSKICYKCPEEDWPDDKKVKCIPKAYEFLCYEQEMLSLIFLGTAIFFCIVTLFVLITFICYWDTPLVKANNRNVSFILLVSILMNFLCIFFFLGRPIDITCLLRQISFGIFFSICISSVLAKTITVCIAFKATKPGRLWVKWTSFNVSYYVVFVCSTVQILFCVLWISISPPYQEFDYNSYPGKIIIQCNEGSDIWFYSMLGYLGLLASVSFVLAFMVRTLPDSFNEAKYITFSMLLFCSVWIAMIPAYLSTRGKYMVAVEIFAILTSCAGILGCIFLPKLYIIFWKPNLNSRKTMLERKF